MSFASVWRKSGWLNLPLGTLEWHGEHLLLGSDAIQSKSLMVECARRFGAIVLPPIYLGPDRGGGNLLYGMDYHESTDPQRQLEGSCYWVSDGFFGTLIDAILAQLKRAGFRMVFTDSHGPSRDAWCTAIPEREQRFGLKLAGATDDLISEWKSQIDHASRNETSLVLHYREDLTDLGQPPDDRGVWPQGLADEDPRDASSEYGKECMEGAVAIVGRLIEESRV